MNESEFAAAKKVHDDAMAAFDVESAKLHDHLATVQAGLADMVARRTLVKADFRRATAAFQMTRLGLSAPNVVSVPTANIKVKGN